MWSALDILRPLNCLMAGVGVMVGALLSMKVLDPMILAAFAAAFVITGAGNAINDFFDFESDRINRPKRPIPSGRISRRYALFFSIVLFAAGILLSAQINWLAFIIALVNSLVLVVYSLSLQNKVLLGNVAVAYLGGSTFLYGGAAAGNIALPLILAFMASLATLSREIVKDLEDIEGDRRSFIKKMASRVRESFADRFRVGPDGIKMKYKTIYAILIASFSLWLSVVISLAPYMWGLLGIAYLVPVLVTDGLLILTSYILIRRRNYRVVSRLLKICMALGLISFLIGIVF